MWLCTYLYMFSPMCWCAFSSICLYFNFCLQGNVNFLKYKHIFLHVYVSLSFSHCMCVCLSVCVCIYMFIYLICVCGSESLQIAECFCLFLLNNVYWRQYAAFSNLFCREKITVYSEFKQFPAKFWRIAKNFQTFQGFLSILFPHLIPFVL